MLIDLASRIRCPSCDFISTRSVEGSSNFDLIFQKREPKVKKTAKVAENGQDKAKADAEGDKEAKGEEGQPPKTEEAAKKKDPYTKLKKCLPPWAGSEQAHQGLKKKMTRTPLALFKEAFEIYADKQGKKKLRIVE